MQPEDLPAILARDGVVTVHVRVRPGARATAWMATGADGVLRLAVRGVAERNKANLAVVRFLAKHCDVPTDHVELLSGQTSPRKALRISARR